MTRAAIAQTGAMVVIVLGVVAVGCTTTTRDALEPSPPAVSTAPTVSAPAVDDEKEANPMPPATSHQRHQTTVVTDAGRIDATAVDGVFDVDVESSDGWESVVERRDDGLRVSWTSGSRSVVVELQSTPTGITQQVTASQ